MAVRRLHDTDWGFDSRCFAHEPRISTGPRSPFHHDDAIGEDTRLLRDAPS